MRNITETLMKPLEKFRKEHLGTVRVTYYGLFLLPNMFCSLVIITKLHILQLDANSEWIVPHTRLIDFFVPKNNLVFFSACTPFTVPSSGGKKEVWEGNGEVLQLSGKASEYVSKEERATATRGIYPCLNSPTDLKQAEKQFIMTAKRMKKGHFV